MSDLLSEPRISFNELARRVDVHPSTIWRWVLRGSRGHVLESFSLGGRRYTTLPAYERWLARLNTQPFQTGEACHQRNQAIAKAEERADALGV